jgi:hypothetical protein
MITINHRRRLAEKRNSTTTSRSEIHLSLFVNIKPVALLVPGFFFVYIFLSNVYIKHY